MSRPRTTHERARLIELAGTMPVSEIAKILNRTENAVAIYACELGLSLVYHKAAYHKWSSKEVHTIELKILDGMMPRDIVELFPHYPVSAVRSQISHVRRRLVKSGLIEPMYKRKAP